MKKQLEIKWVIFLLTTLLTSFGLITRFSFQENLNIAIHDSHFIIDKVQLLVLFIFILFTSYFTTLGIKALAKTNSFFRFSSIVLSGLFSIVLITLLIFPTLILITSSPFVFDYTIIGFIVLTLGLSMLFTIRTKEIWKTK